MSKVFKNQDTTNSMIVYSNHDDNTPGMRVVITGNDGSPRALKPQSAHDDLACLSVKVSCQGDASRNILLFQREGEACHPIIERLPNDYFVDQWLKLADGCIPTGLLGETKVGNGFYFPFNVEFQPSSMQAYATTWSIRAEENGTPEVNPQYAELAFDEPVSAVRAVPSASRGLAPDSSAHKITVQAFAEGGGFSTINPGEHRIQADCGSGFEDIRPLDEMGRYRDDTASFPDAVDGHEADMASIENCDIRVGYRP